MNKCDSYMRNRQRMIDAKQRYEKLADDAREARLRHIDLDQQLEAAKGPYRRQWDKYHVVKEAHDNHCMECEVAPQYQG